MKFKIKKTPKNGLKISLILVIIILILLAIVNFIPDEGIKTEYGFKIDNGTIPVWKKVCQIIIVILCILELIVTRVMCKCQQCKKYVVMNIHTEYCPYCSKKIED